MKINLGCGTDIKEGFVNVDRMKIPGVDVVADIDGGKLPFKDNSVEMVFLSHILEHICDLEKLLKEIYRICKPNAKIYIKVPYFSHESAFSHYQHVRRFSWTTFDLFNPRHPAHFHTDIQFRVVKRKLLGRFIGDRIIFNWFPRIYQEYLAWIFPVKEIRYVLEVVKK